MNSLHGPAPEAVAPGPSVPTATCRFCAIADGRGSQWPDTVLFATRSYVVIASVGALVPGWVMLVPRQHSLNLVDAFTDSEFSSLRLRISRNLADRYPSKTIRLFEHGAQTCKKQVGCGVDHAHLHLVPLRNSLVPRLTQQRSPRDWRLLSLSSVPAAVAGREYLLYGDHAEIDNPECWLSLPPQPQSQFFRRVLATVMGKPEQYNYHLHPHFSNVAATQATLSDLRYASSSAAIQSPEIRLADG